MSLLGLDGIDLTQNQGYGTDNMNANDESSIQVLDSYFYLDYGKVVSAVVSQVLFGPFLTVKHIPTKSSLSIKKVPVEK